MRIVTRPDFDGIVCAVLLHEAEVIDSDIYWVEPSEIQNKKAMIQKGDIMKVYLKIDGDNTIKDVRYEITGCAGAISAAMAAVELVKGKTIDDALKMNDGDVFEVLQNIPEKKHHCIQLAVKTMHKGLKEYKTEKVI